MSEGQFEAPHVVSFEKTEQQLHPSKEQKIPDGVSDILGM